MRCLAVRLTLFCLMGWVSLARSQSVNWQAGADDGPVRLVQLVFVNAEPVSQVRLPQLPGVVFTTEGSSEDTSIMDGQSVRSVKLLYSIVSHRNSPVVIPEIEVMTNKGAMRVASAEIPPTAVSMESIAVARLKAGRASVWAGEVFDLNYEFAAIRKCNPQISPTPVWNPAGAVMEAWSKPEVREVVLGGERWVRVSYRSRALTRAADAVQFEPVYHPFNVPAETPAKQTSLQSRTRRLSVWSNDLGIKVRPLPGPPQDFSGAVGQFKLSSHVVPEVVAAHEPITWTLALSGTGNWPEVLGLPQRQASNDFDVVVAKPKHTFTEGRLFDGSIEEDAVLFPGRPGTYILGPVRFVFFDPEKGQYITLTTPATKVTVTPGSSPRPPPGVSYAAQKAGEQTFGGTKRKLAALPDSSNATLNAQELKLEALRKADSPSELFRKIRQAEGKDSPANGKY